jgi:RNA polymerase sigma-70 factor, ECF subfamily
VNIDKEIIARAKEGDQKAMGEMYTHYKDYVLRSAWFILGKQEEAEDVMENVFLKVFTHLHTFNMERDFKPWLSRIILNEARNLFHKRKGTYDNTEAFIDGASSSGVSHEEKIDIRTHLAKMDYECRELILMRFYQDLTLEEIARIKKITLTNAKVRIHRALKKMKESMKSDA